MKWLLNPQNPRLLYNAPKSLLSYCIEESLFLSSGLLANISMRGDKLPPNNIFSVLRKPNLKFPRVGECNMTSIPVILLALKNLTLSTNQPNYKKIILVERGAPSYLIFHSNWKYTKIPGVFRNSDQIATFHTSLLTYLMEAKKSPGLSTVALFLLFKFI